jgi:hypothetical protein
MHGTSLRVTAFASFNEFNIGVYICSSPTSTPHDQIDSAAADGWEYPQHGVSHPALTTCHEAMACESHISTIRVVIAYETNTDVLDICMQADSLTMLTCLLTVIFCLSCFLSAISSSDQLVSRVTDSTHVLTILVDSVRLVLYHSYKESL